MKKLLVPLIIGLSWAFPSFAVDYVTVKPIEQVVTSSIRDCRGGEGSTVPTITWGADAVTYFANGNSPTTQAGSIFADAGLNVTLKRQDVFTDQVSAYLSCESPWIRGTLGQLNLIASLTENDPRTKMVIVSQLSWSNGGDVLVASDSIKTPADLKGKTIALQAYGPHIDYLATILSDANLTLKDVNLKFVKDLTGDSDSTPYISFLSRDADAAMVIVPDAITLTSDFSVGTGSDGSRKGAHALLSTKSCSRCINDVYAVRADYLSTTEGKKEVQKFVNAWFIAEEKFVKSASKTKPVLKATAKYLLDAPSDIAGAEGLILDAETAGYAMNKKFFNENAWPRSFNKLNAEIRKNYQGLGLTKTSAFDHIGWNYDELKAGIANVTVASSALNDAQHKAVTKIVTSKAMMDDNDGSLFTFQINFLPNSNTIDTKMYEEEFKRVQELVAKYSGAVITVEGHADPLGYLKSKKATPSAKAVHTRIRQSALNTSLTRAVAVRDAIMQMASDGGYAMHKNQFVTIGHGIKKPLSGTKNGEPLPPRTKQEWLSNMRVVFKLVNIEAEASEFELL